MEFDSLSFVLRKFHFDEISNKIKYPPPFRIVGLSGKALSLVSKDKGNVHVGQVVNLQCPDDQGRLALIRG